MKLKSMLAPVVVIAGAAVITGCSKQKAGTEEVVESVEEMVKPPSDSSVAEDIWLFFAEDVQKNISGALDKFKNDNVDSAANGIRKAAAIMKIEAQRATGKDRKYLNASIAELNALADRVGKKAVVSSAEFEKPFGDAQFVLGNFHLSKAKDMWLNKFYFETGQELREASLNFKNAYLWFDHKIDESTQKSLSQSRKVADELIINAVWSRDDVVASLAMMDNEAGKLQPRVDILK